MAPPRRKPVIVSSDEEQPHISEDAISDDDSTPRLSSQPHPLSQSKASPVKSKRSEARVKQNAKVKSETKQSPRKTAPARAAPTTALHNGKGRGTLFSFFNSATQKQQSSSQGSVQRDPQPAPRQGEVSQVYPLIADEDIVDTIDDGTGESRILNGAATALAARKRKQNDASHLFGPDIFNAAAGSQKFMKSTEGNKVVTNGGGLNRRPWTDEYGPVDLSELAVHKKKVADVRSVLEESVSPRARPRLVVLKGPAGAGKTTTLRLLARDLGLLIKEWKNPDSGGAGDTGSSTSAQFEDFIFRSGKYAGLTMGTDEAMMPIENAQPEEEIAGRHIMLVEEFPVTMTRTSTILQSFRATIQAYLAAPKRQSHSSTPIVVIVSETLLSSGSGGEALTPHRLLGPALLTHPLTAVIEFNPLAPTLLTKAMSVIAVKESRVSGRRRTPGPAVLSKLAEMGDIRSAVGAFEFLCLRGDDDSMWSSKISFSKPKGTRNPARTNGMPADDSMTEHEREALRFITGRETSLELWHAVGKVIYNKRVDPERPAPQPPPHMISLYQSKTPENDPDQLYVDSATEAATYIAAIHENLPPSWSSPSVEKTLESMEACLSVLSDAEILLPDRHTGVSGGTALESARQEEIAFHSAVRGVVLHLPYPVKRDAGPSSDPTRRGRTNVMAWPRSLRLWRDREEKQDILEHCMDEYWKILRTEGIGADSKDRNAEPSFPTRPSASSFLSMTLEQAPFMKLIQEARRTSSTLSRNIATVATLTTLHMTNPQDASAARDVDAEDNAEEDRKRRTRTTNDGNGMNFGVEESITGLVLSDDDIVDD